MTNMVMDRTISRRGTTIDVSGRLYETTYNVSLRLTLYDQVIFLTERRATDSNKFLMLKHIFLGNIKVVRKKK